MPVPPRYRRSIPILLAALLLGASALVPAASVTAAPADPPGLDAFLQALGQFESGGRYDAVNPSSGAYGKYQIMPFNWPAWARLYLGDAKAPQTPANQERVARAKVIALHRWLGSWPRVANWWLNGDANPPSMWTAYTRSYVDRIMALAARSKGVAAAQAGTAPAGSKGGKPAPRPPSHLAERDPAITYSGWWGSASHPGYAGGHVAWAITKGAAAGVTFTGRSISWIGPVGPTRGAAQVWLDGRMVATVSQYARSYAPRRTIFARDLGTSGTHTLRIVVSATSGHPMVAIDELVVGF